MSQSWRILSLMEEDDAPAGDTLLARLRGVGLERPLIDRDVERRIRSDLETVAAPAGDLPPGVTVRLTKNRLRQVLLCERHLVASLETDRDAASLELVRGRILDRVFIQVAVGYPIGADPVGEVLGAAAVAGEPELLDAWEALPVDEQTEVHETVSDWATALATRWPALPEPSLIRFQEPLRVELAAGRVVLSGRVDLALGRPGADRAGTTLLDIKSGKRHYDHALDVGWYAVLETLRHHAAPFQTGSYYLRDGGLDLDVIDSDRLGHAAGRIAEGVGRLVRLAAGATAMVTPNGLCPWCPVLGSCEPGSRHAAESGLDLGLWLGVTDDEDDDDVF